MCVSVCAQISDTRIQYDCLFVNGPYSVFVWRTNRRRRGKALAAKRCEKMKNNNNNRTDSKQKMRNVPVISRSWLYYFQYFIWSIQVTICCPLRIVYCNHGGPLHITGRYHRSPSAPRSFATPEIQEVKLINSIDIPFNRVKCDAVERKRNSSTLLPTNRVANITLNHKNESASLLLCSSSFFSLAHRN